MAEAVGLSNGLWSAAQKGFQMLSRLLSHHGRGQHPCPLCEASDLTSTVLGHVLSSHGAEVGTRVETSSELLIEDLSTSHISLLPNLGTCLIMLHIFEPYVNHQFFI